MDSQPEKTNAVRQVRFHELQEAIDRVEMFSGAMSDFILEMQSGSTAEQSKGTEAPDTFCSVYHGAPKYIHTICEDLERKLTEIRDIIF